jgi:filamentous hemagglutinin family protein
MRHLQETGVLRQANPHVIQWIQNSGFWFTATLLLALSPAPALSQIAGDNTLGTQVNNDVTAPCTGNCLITNGSQRGTNLFHSLREFSLPNLTDVAGFVIPPAIQNVLVRVTGSNISTINGTITTFDPTFSTIAPVNFFFLNPNGILFGANARIFVGGSFLASTGERLLFRDGTVFDTRDRTVNPLLTVSVPTGLQMGQTPGRIQAGFRIGAGQNSFFTDFALVGGDVTLDNAIVIAPGQRVEVGSVGALGSLGLITNGDSLSLSFLNATLRSDVVINRSRLDLTVR